MSSVRFRANARVGRLGLVLVALLIAMPGLGAIGPSSQAVRSPATGAISGIVADAATGAPISGALVRLSTPEDRAGRAHSALTDAKGRFVFSDLAASDAVAVLVTKLGYLEGGAANSPNASSGPLTVADGEWLRDVRVRLWRPASIGGRVVDERGDAVVGVYVRAVTLVEVVGRSQFAAGPTAITDEQGRYRLSGLAPGRYVVEMPSASSLPEGSAEHLPISPVANDGRALTYAMTFAPSAATPASATVVLLGYAEERNGVDIAIVPVEARVIAGQVVGSLTSLPRVVRLLLAGGEELGVGSEAATARVAPDGSFVFRGVPAGSYTIDASRTTASYILPQDFFDEGSRLTIGSRGGVSEDLRVGPPGLMLLTSKEPMPGAWARAPVVVEGSDVTGLVVSLRESGTLRGQIAKDIVADRPQPQLEPGVRLDPADGSLVLGAPQSDIDPRFPAEGGAFAIRGVMPGRYFLRAQFGWALKSVMWRGRDYADRPFDAAEMTDVDGVDVVVTNNVASLAGRVRDERGTAAVNAVVVAFPADAASWSDFGLWPPAIRSTAVSANGQYLIKDLPAGSYRVVAIASLDAAAALGRAFFAAVDSVAREVSLKWGQSASIDLVVHRMIR